MEPSGWEDADCPGYGVWGIRGVPDVGQATSHLRWVAGHLREAVDLGRNASAWVHRHRNVWDKGPHLLEVIRNRYGR